jgi:hypothetical protein
LLVTTIISQLPEITQFIFGRASQAILNIVELPKLIAAPPAQKATPERFNDHEDIVKRHIGQSFTTELPGSQSSQNSISASAS